MTEKLNLGGSPSSQKKYTPAFKAECVRQVAAGARQSDVARAQGLSPALLGRWQRQALVEAVPSSAEREEIKRLRAELKRVEQERDILKKVVTSACLTRRLSQPPPS
jgi:transposase